jgi:hypothetical protein
MLQANNPEYISSIPSKLVLENNKQTIQLNGDTIIKEYSEYRDEQKLTQMKKR